MASKTISPKNIPVKSITVKASKANKVVVTPKPVIVPKVKADPLKPIEKHIKDFEPVELSEGLNYDAKRIYTIHNAWAKVKPLVEHLAKGLRGKLKTEFDELTKVLESINPNPGA